MQLSRAIVMCVLALSVIFAYVTPAYANDEQSDADLVVRVVVREADTNRARCAVLLHGLARTSGSMNTMSKALNAAGWHTANVDYPSRKFPIEDLAPRAVTAGLEACRKLEATRIDAVTHSLGGILIRHYLASTDVPEFGRAVFLGPPNHGSEVVDGLKEVPGFTAFNGPAGLQLGTDANSVPNTIGASKHDVAIIAGTVSINLLLSNFLPNPDDGKVSVASARLDGMCGFITVPVAHPFIMKDSLAIKHTRVTISDRTVRST